MADEDQTEMGNAAASGRGVAAFAQIAEEAGQVCDGCTTPIVGGQHYIRLAVMFDTAGMEALHVLRLPDGILWSGIFDDPVCAALALMRAGQHDPIFTDVFRR